MRLVNRTTTGKIAYFECLECGRVSKKSYIKKTFEPVCRKCLLGIVKFRKERIRVHGDTYCYGKVQYEHSQTKVTITCKVHGDFDQTPSMHVIGQGCPRCGTESMGMANASSKDEFITKSIKKFGNKFSYKKTVYNGIRSKVTINCHKHGEIIITPESHFNMEFGCPYCHSKKDTTKSFIEKVKIIHENKYSYEKLIFKNLRTRVIVTCRKHGDFEQLASSHLSGRGCWKCHKNGFDKNSPAILYYLFFPKQKLYKIGITNRTIRMRFSITERKQFEVIGKWKFKLGRFAYNIEQSLLTRYSKYKYNGPPLLKNGNSELFTIDILNN